jgi:hypothetical protein
MDVNARGPNDRQQNKTLQQVNSVSSLTNSGIDYKNVSLCVMILYAF